MERVVAQYPDLHQQFEMPTIEMEGGETFVVGNDDDLKVRYFGVSLLF
jgi:hypothetical protein